MFVDSTEISVSSVSLTNQMSSLDLNSSAVVIHEIVHVWETSDKTREVRLLRNGNDLKYQVVNNETGQEGPFGRIVLGSLSVEEAVAQVLNRIPVIQDDDVAVKFVRENLASGVQPQEKLEVAESRIDPRVVIIPETCAVTLIDSISPLPGGHASILVEGLSNGQYFIKRAHITSDDKKNKVPAFISLSELSDEKFIELTTKITEVTETWLVQEWRVKEMLKKIELQGESFTQGKPRVILDLRGKDAFGTDYQGPMIAVHNCFTWARDVLSISGIDLYQDNKWINGPLRPSKMIFTPATHISSSSVYSKKRVVVLIALYDEKLKTSRYLENNYGLCARADVTEEIHERMGGNSWKAIHNDEPFTATIVKTNTSGSGNYKIIGKVVIPVLARDKENGQEQEIDVTEDVQRQIDAPVYSDASFLNLIFPIEEAFEDTIGRKLRSSFDLSREKL